MEPGIPRSGPRHCLGGILPPSPSPRGKFPAFGFPFGAFPAGIPSAWEILTPLPSAHHLTMF
ncbi:hypothetical protein PIB30_072084, partial [Stylosanthes scabra]|nr:hypothetical protein [Stylosanthes scabra]